jgi:hypothetical protein
MLERYFIRPDTVDRIRASWIGEPIERYVGWLTEHRYSTRNVFRRVPILVRFGTFAADRGATRWDELPAYVRSYVAAATRAGRIRSRMTHHRGVRISRWRIRTYSEQNAALAGGWL